MDIAHSQDAGKAAVRRLQTRAQFQAALGGTTVSKTAHFALHCCPVTSPSSATSLDTVFPVTSVWLGGMVPKRWAKRAVTRNAIKRQIYSVGAEFAPALQERAHLVRLRAGFDRAEYVSATSTVLKKAVRLELLQLFSRLVPGAPASLPAVNAKVLP